MFRIAKPESFVLISPSKQDVRATCTGMPVDALANSNIGRQTKRCRMHASDHGTSFRVLQRAIACPRFPIAVSVSHDCLQLLRASVTADY